MKYTTEEFIDLLKDKERLTFEKTIYSGNKNKCIFTCIEHGDFLATPNNVLSKNSGCPKCGTRQGTQVRAKTLDRFILEATKLHCKCTYEKFIYINMHTKGIITCIEHGDFLQRPNDHLSKKAGCPKCDGEIVTNLQEFIEVSSQEHKNEFTYENSIWNGTHSKIIITCKIHGDFEQLAGNHYHLSQKCPKCKSSKGEILIRQILIENNIKYQEQYSFTDCRDKRMLKFDFAIFDNDKLIKLIEYQGEQHYKPISFGSKSTSSDTMFESVIKRDQIKKDYCQNNNISLLVIPYHEKENISDMLLNELLNPQVRSASFV